MLLTPGADAVWVTSWPFAEYVRHDWPGAWVNSLFRREGGLLASELIWAAVAASRWYFGSAPALGIVTFIDTAKTRRKRDPGRCYRRAGWTERGWTKGGLLCLGLSPADMPAPLAPMGTPGELFTEEHG